MSCSLLSSSSPRPLSHKFHIKTKNVKGAVDSECVSAELNVPPSNCYLVIEDNTLIGCPGLTPTGGLGTIARFTPNKRKRKAKETL
jgi:hypothetical protein